MKKLLTKTLLPIVATSALLAASPSQAGFFSDWFSPAKTKNPIILVPGIFAFDTIAGVDYWYQIPSSLEKRGATVHVAKINAFDNNTLRGETLIAQMEEIKAASGGKVSKFNIMGHSQGGTTGRYVMNVRPDLVASLTTMNTPHTGSPVADLMTDNLPPESVQGVMFEVVANGVGNLVNLLSDNKKDESDIYGMLGEFNQEGAAAFNAAYPLGVPTEACGTGPAQVTIDGHDINLYSWGGVKVFTNPLDISDPLFATAGLAFDKEVENDGIVGKCANHFGKVLRDNYTMNHIDVNNHVLGLVSLFETNPKTVFKNHAKRLKAAGL